MYENLMVPSDFCGNSAASLNLALYGKKNEKKFQKKGKKEGIPEKSGNKKGKKFQKKNPEKIERK